MTSARLDSRRLPLSMVIGASAGPRSRPLIVPLNDQGARSCKGSDPFSAVVRLSVPEAGALPRGPLAPKGPKLWKKGQTPYMYGLHVSTKVLLNSDGRSSVL